MVVLDKDDFRRKSTQEQEDILKYLRQIADYYIDYHNILYSEDVLKHGINLNKDEFYEFLKMLLFEYDSLSNNVKSNIFVLMETVNGESVPIGFSYVVYYLEDESLTEGVGSVIEFCAPKSKKMKFGRKSKQRRD